MSEIIEMHMWNCGGSDAQFFFFCIPWDICVRSTGTFWHKRQDEKRKPEFLSTIKKSQVDVSYKDKEKYEKKTEELWNICINTDEDHQDKISKNSL